MTELTGAESMGKTSGASARASSAAGATLLGRELSLDDALASLAQFDASAQGLDDERRLFELLASHVAGTLGDLAVVDAFDADARLARVAVAVASGEGDGRAEAVLRRFPPRLDGDSPSATALRDGRLHFAEGVEPRVLMGGMADAFQLEILRSFGETCAVVAAPITTRSGVVGALTLTVGEREGRRFGPSHVALVGELAKRVSSEVERVRLREAAKRDAAAADLERRRADDAGSSKDEFLAVISHELRTPLSAILGWARILRSESSDEPRRKRAVEIIERNARAQAQLIEDILDLSRVTAGKMRLARAPLDLAALLRAVVEATRPSAEAKRIELASIDDAAVVRVSADGERLRQVFANLLSNAVKFTAEGGRVELAMRSASDAVEVSVRDDGQGIDVEFLPYVFDRFRQGDAAATRRHGGLGLGLAIVKHLVEAHGGAVMATSAGRGHGASFSVRLPLGAAGGDEGGGPASRGRATTSTDGSLPALTSLDGLRVLVVDDEPEARELLVALLEQARARVQSAASAREALALMRAGMPDVVVSDLAMPDEDGFAFLRRVRELPEGGARLVPAVALTALSRSQDRARSLLAGYAAHVTKPVDPAELLLTIAHVTGRLRRG